MRFPSAFPLLLVLAAALCATPVAATGEPAGFTLLGSAFTGEPFPLGNDLVAESDSLYVTIRDLGDPAQARVVGWLDHSQTCSWSGIVADGALLVGLAGDVGVGNAGFSVVDLTDPLSPVYHGDFGGMYLDSAWLRGRALAVTTGELLIVFDLADLDAPVPSGFMLLGAHTGGRWFTAVDNTLFLIDHDATIRALDVSDAHHPVSLGTPTLTGERLDALAGGDGVVYALVAVEVGGADERIDLVTCDVSVPAAPLETTRQTLFTATGAAGTALVREGDLLVAAGTDGQVRAFGLADAAHPIAGWTVAHAASRVVITSGAVLVSEGRDLLTYRRTAADVPPPPPTRRSPLPLLETVVGEGPVQVAKYFQSPRRLATLDVSDPFQPRLGPPLDLPANAPLQYAGGVGLMTTDMAQLIDFADPAHPVPRGRILWLDGHPDWRLWAPDLVTMENPVSGAAVWLYDTSDLDDPALLGHVPEFHAFGAGDGLLACGDANGTRLYDIRDLEAPVRVAALTDAGAVAVAAFWRDHLYTSTTHAGKHCLDTWDLSDRSAPRRLASAILPAEVTHLDRHGARLYAQYPQGAAIFDLADPGSPTPVGEPLRFNTWFHAFAVNGNVTTLTTDLVSVRNDGLAPAAAPWPTAPVTVRLSPACPNPCNPATTVTFAVDAERDLALSVYDIRGRHVAEIAHGRFTAGTHRATWNGTGAAGEAVAAGVYLLRLHGPGVEAVRAVTLLK